MIIPSTQSATLGIADAALTLAVDDADSVALQITGTFTGTITFEASVDGTNWASVAVKASSQTTATTLVTTTTAAGVFTLNTQGLPYVRARMSAYTSGSATALARASRVAK